MGQKTSSEDRSTALFTVCSFPAVIPNSHKMICNHFSLSTPVLQSRTSPYQRCPEDGCRQPKVCQGLQRSAQTGRTASSETDGSGSASWSSVESTGE